MRYYITMCQLADLISTASVNRADLVELEKSLGFGMWRCNLKSTVKSVYIRSYCAFLYKFCDNLSGFCLQSNIWAIYIFSLLIQYTIL